MVSMPPCGAQAIDGRRLAELALSGRRAAPGDPVRLARAAMATEDEVLGCVDDVAHVHQNALARRGRQTRAIRRSE